MIESIDFQLCKKILRKRPKHRHYIFDGWVLKEKNAIAGSFQSG